MHIVVKYLSFSYFLLLSLLCSKAQENQPLLNTTNNATLVGIGTSSLYDTYLSPLKYHGTSIHLLHERMKQFSWFDSKFVQQQIYSLEFDWADNPAKNSTEYAAILNIKLGGHYSLITTKDFKFGVGGFWNLVGGILYNERNSNNPASGKVYTNINVSAIALYNWKNFTFRGQVDSPLLGMAFSPNYRQSYYQISLSNSLSILNFVSIHNQRAADIYLSVDIPVNKVTLRAGYLGSFYQTKIHNIHTHNYSNNLMIGIVSESLSFSGKKIKENKLINSVYY